MEHFGKQAVQAHKPTAEEQERILNIMEDAYAPTTWNIPFDLFTKDHFMRCLKGLDNQSSPGWPYKREAPTIGQWLGFNGVWYDPVRIEELWFDTKLVIMGRFEHVMYAFIKPEPHKKAKVDLGRWRLIIASALPVQMAWRMCFQEHNDREIDYSYFIPSQQGITLFGGAWKQYLRQWKAAGYDTGLDKSAFDFTAAGWALKLDLEYRRRMSRGSQDLTDEWYQVASRLYYDMFRTSKILMPEGYVWEQQFWGYMKSGCVNTISTNSHLQIMYHILACWEQNVSVHPLPVACGDDTLQRLDQATDLKAYSKYGLVVKSASDELEFVGHEFTDEGPMPLYSEKHICALIHCKEEVIPEYVEAMCRMYVHGTPEMVSFWHYLARKLRVSVRSPEYYRTWYDWAD